MFYEHLLTLQREIRLIWKGPANIASTVFIANRYVALIYVLCGLVTLNPNSSCAVSIIRLISTAIDSCHAYWQRNTYRGASVSF